MLREPPADSGDGDAGDAAAPTVVEVLRAALAPLAARIDAAFLYGTLAAGAVTGQGHLDVMIIARDLTYAEVIPNFIAAAKYIGRTINPSVYSTDEWARKFAAGNRVAIAVMKQPRIFLLGADNNIPRPR
jgi:hypothetical protein